VQRLCDLLPQAGLPPEAVLNLVRELWAAHCDEAALAVTASVADQDGYAEVRQWAAGR